MSAFRLFPRYRKPSLGEIAGTTQAKRRWSRKYHQRLVRDPLSPLKNARRRALRRAGYYSSGARFMRALLRLFR